MRLHRNAQVCGQIFRYAITIGKAAHDPAADLKGALTTPQEKHYHYLSSDELPEFMQTLAAYHGDPLTRLGLHLLIHTMVRTTELRAATWDEFNLDKKEWRIPASRMKMKETHIVPLTEQALSIIEEIKAHSGDSPHLFPHMAGKEDSIMSNNTMLFALYRMGYKGKATTHGYRADVIERQLAHAERNKVRKAYNHAEYLPERKAMMKWWSDYLQMISEPQAKAKRAN